LLHPGDDRRLRPVLLDEATRSVDALTEERFPHALVGLRRDRTSFVTAHLSGADAGPDAALSRRFARVVERA
jgi:ABC-type transport system involved in cytochrome bd biosynthesis fused ATPase/permease subunit